MTVWQHLRRLARKLWVSGIRLRCPNCEQGRIFPRWHLLRIKPTCDVCGVRYERLDGESVGGMMFTLGIIPPVAIAGFFLVDWLTPLSIPVNAALWLVFILLGVTLMYRHSRAAWVAVSYLTGGVYADDPPAMSDAQREQIVGAAHRATGPHKTTSALHPEDES